MDQPPLPAEPPAPSAQPQPQPPARSNLAATKAPKPRYFRGLLLAATASSLLSTVVFVLYLVSPRGTDAERTHAHPLYLMGLIGLAVAEACQLLGILALIARWASHYNTERRLREILILILSLIPYMVLVIFLATVIAYFRERRRSPGSERTRELKQELKEQTVDIFIGEGTSQSSSLAGGQPVAQAPAPASQVSQASQASQNVASTVRPPMRGAVSRVIGPSTEGELSRAGNWLVTLTMVAVVLATVATLGALTPLNRLVPQQQGAALATPTPTMAIPTVTPTPTPATGTMIKELAAGANPEGLMKAPDGSVWFADSAGKIGHMTPDGQVTEFPLANSYRQPANLTMGPDGNVWFTMSNSSNIGRVTPSGVITVYPIPSGAWLFDIAVGPDGNLWCTTNYDDRIERVTPGGAVTEFRVPLPSGTMSPIVTYQPGIVAGPDGRMWFAIPYLNDIGTITMSGSIAEIPLGSYDITDMTLGPDGNLWFSEAGTNDIGRVTPAGVVTQFPLPNSGPEPYSLGITTGPDGNLWFTTRTRIGRITTSGAVTEYDWYGQDNSLSPPDIITGPDGNLWFSLTYYGKIVEVAP